MAVSGKEAVRTVVRFARMQVWPGPQSAFGHWWRGAIRDPAWESETSAAVPPEKARRRLPGGVCSMGVQGEQFEAQGDELRSDAGAGARAVRGDRGPVGTGAALRRGGGPRVPGSRTSATTRSGMAFIVRAASFWRCGGWTRRAVASIGARPRLARRAPTMIAVAGRSPGRRGR